MSDPMKPEFTAQNPIVEAATRIRARRELGSVADDAAGGVPHKAPEDAEESLQLFARQLSGGCKKINAILAPQNVKLVRLERPLRLRLRFGDKRVALNLDEVAQLVAISGLELDGEYQFDLASAVPSLINISKISSDAEYGVRLTASSLLKRICEDAELPRPPHLGASGPLQL
ncbi:MAG: hypothetical protein ABI282_00790 [Candidatus Baltobacteraceae bacterium]